MDAALTQHDLLEEARFKGLAEKLDELSNKRDARLMHLCGQLDYMRVCRARLMLAWLAGHSESCQWSPAAPCHIPATY
jgi:hypothetical protein